MFKFLKKDPKEKLNKEYLEILKKAMEAQRSGDIKTYSTLSAEAEKILDQINSL